MLRSAHAACVLALFVVAAPTWAQSKKPPSSAFVPTKVDTTWESLPSGFRGSDPSRIADWVERLSGVSAPPDRFKKTEERLGEAMALRPAIGEVGPIGVLLGRDLGRSTLGRDTCRINYEADREQITFSPPTSEFPAFAYIEKPTIHHRKVTVKSVDRSQSPYVGSNAFGASVEVTRVRYDEVSLAMPGAAPRGAWGAITMAPQDARAVFDHLACVLVFTPMPPYYYLAADTTRPTLDSPFQIHTSDRVVFASIASLWLVDMRSRSILKKADR